MKGILILNDIHVPFNRNDIFDIVKKHTKEIQAIIFGGDLIDCKSISSFPSLDDITIEDEIKQAIEFMTKIREIVGDKVKIIVLEGNHEARWRTYISKMHDKKLYKFIDPHVLQMLKDGMVIYQNDKKEVCEGVKDIEIIDDWWINYKGIIVCHPYNFYKQPCKNSNTAVEYFIKKGEKFKVLVCAHNHHQSMCHHYGKWSIESGCLCQEFDYTKAKTTSITQDYGYVLIKFKGKEIDYDKSKIYVLEGEKING